MELSHHYPSPDLANDVYFLLFLFHLQRECKGSKPSSQISKLPK